ncbi:MAG: hypothetical protein EOR12_32345 [Mesorhizobium sp.]|uniref:TIR domain-containing protein n=1 Tax=Mesorhizobium sp. TaxID=1871066 RepID=UPI000FE63406|nr:TIR domain-containing protein [Mesorhizobium sp.]RWP82052.1 MAG: hypothetical protein EOR12_32345 [Mesorhizobium sp.]
MKKTVEEPTKIASKPKPKSLRIFYAWQSDLASAANLNGIRNALRAVKKITEANIDLTLDEATRDTPGSPYIPDKITEKIRICDLFIADVTTITGKGNNTRPCANPNVIFELGYAVAQVGWDRIILLINDKVSPVSDLPFDFDRHRAMIYQHDEKPAQEQRDEFAKALRAAIEMVASHDPPRPKDLEGLSPEQIRRQRDVNNIKWALEQVHQPSIDDLVCDLPYKISDKALWYFESFKGVVTNSLFHIYDVELSKLFEDMLDGWESAVSSGEHYQISSNPHVYIWVGNQPSAEKSKIRVVKGATKLDAARKAILGRIRKSYVDVDIDATSRKAFEAYRSDLKDI